MRNGLLILLLVGSGGVFAQTLVFPDQSGWAQLEEGKALSFTLKLSDDSPARYVLEGGSDVGMQLDSLGRFTWTPSYDLVDRLTKQKEISVIFQATWKDKKVRQPVNFTVVHVNRPPVVDDLPTLYVRQGSNNKYQIPAEYVRDPDGDPIIFKPRESELPEGAQLTSLGQFTWSPSRSQFNGLRANPLVIEFVVQDQPDKAETIGKLRIAQTQLDLPPELLLVPSDSIWNIRENEVIYMKVYVSDPNGDDNIEQVGFISTDMRVPKSVLKENSRAQWEFTWSPGYDFVEEAEKKKDVQFTFFAFDKSNNRVQRKVRVMITDTENVEEKDKNLYQKYLNSMTATTNMLNLLDANNDVLEKTYKKARKGKKSRTVINASLGAMTGVSPLVLPTDPSKVVSVVGGTSVLTLNSLEAGQVIGRNANDYQNRLKSNRDLRTQLQLKGNFFARKYALKSTRRGPEFEQDRDDLARLMNNDTVAALALPADARPAPTLKEIKKMFPDFADVP